MSIRITGMNSGLDTDSMVRELVNAYEKQGQKYTKAQTKTEWKQEAWKDLNGKIKNFYAKYASEMRFSTNYNKKSTTVSNPSIASVTAGGNAVTGSQTLSVKSLASTGYLTGAKINATDGAKVTGDTKLSDLGFTGKTTITIGQGQAVDGVYAKTKTFDVDGDMTLDKVANLFKDAGYNANFDAATGRMFISSKESGADNDFALIGGGDALTALGLTEASGAKKLDGADAQIELNGVDFYSSTNTFSINGLTITAKGLSEKSVGEDGKVSYAQTTLVTDMDVDAVYDNIKSFIKEYSSLMNEMDKLYNAPSAKKYEPLTSEEKDALTDDEIEKWETKIKDSLLKGDSDISAISSAMKQAMLSSIEVNGSKYSLSDFGIGTMEYFLAEDNEKNALHIDGDKDDSATSAKEDKLRAMIASDPGAVTGFFQKLSEQLYDNMTKIQKESNNYKSYGNFYSDKKLQSEYDSQTKQVTKWEDYVAKMEQKYYKQFTAMEKAMSELQNQQNSLGQLFAM